MNWDQGAGSWKQISGQVKQKWGGLTDDELTSIAGKARRTRRQAPGTPRHWQMTMPSANWMKSRLRCVSTSTLFMAARRCEFRDGGAETSTNRAFFC